MIAHNAADAYNYQNNEEVTSERVVRGTKRYLLHLAERYPAGPFHRLELSWDEKGNG